MPGPKRAKAEVDQAAVLANALASSSPSADSAGLLRDLVNEWGGTAEVARSMKREYDNADEGSQTRQRYMEMFQRLVIMNTQHALSKPLDPASLADGDLERVVLKLLGKVSNATAAAAGA